MKEVILEGSAEDYSWQITGNNLRDARGERTQEDVSVLLGVDKSTYSKWETGKQAPMLHHSGRLEKVMGRSMRDLFPNCYLVEKPQFDLPGQLTLELEEPTNQVEE